MALLRSGIGPTNVETGWGHGFVQAQFAGQLISRRKIYSASLRGTLLHLMELRHRADYQAIGVSKTQATRALQQARVFIAAVEALILAHYPDATFAVFHGEDPEGTYLRATVDIEDLDEVMDLVTDLLLDIEVEQGLPVYIALTQPDGRIAAQLRTLPDLSDILNILDGLAKAGVIS